jgi:arsenite-transporting ATPase
MSAATRILLFTGKGGVGKTTTAAATAVRCADAGLRTIVLSTDPAHSLADAFDVPLGPIVTEISPKLHGQQLDAQERMEESWHEIQGWLREVFAWAGVDGLEAEELSVVPGLDEIFALTDIKQYATSGEWDVVVVDCAPTAETIRFLSLPDVLARYMERLFPVGRRVNKVVSPVLSRLTSLPVAGDDVFAATNRFYERLEGVREILTDPERTSVRLVVNPERIVIAEARRTYTYLSLFGYRVDAVVANGCCPTPSPTLGSSVGRPSTSSTFARSRRGSRRSRCSRSTSRRPSSWASTRCAASGTRSTATSTPPPGSTRASPCG